MAINISSAAAYYTAAASSGLSFPSGANWSVGFIAKLKDGTNNNNLIFCYGNYQDKPSFNINWQPTAGWYAITQPTVNGDFYTVDPTNWHVLVVQPTSDGTKIEMKSCLVNGSAIVGTAHGQPVTQTPLDMSSTPLTLGNNLNHTTDQFWNGDIYSAWQFTNSRLSDDDVIAIANGKHIIDYLEKAPAAYWIFNDVNDTTDLSGNKHTLTKTGTPTKVDNPVFTESIAITDMKAKHVFQRGSGSTGNAIIKGKFVGAPTAIQARIVPAAGGTDIVDWTSIDTTPTKQNFSKLLSVPVGGLYKAQVRFSNKTTLVSEGSNSWAVGDVYGFYGQSEMRQMTHTERGYTGGTANAKASRIDVQASTTYVAPALNGENAFLNRIIGKTGTYTSIVAGPVDGKEISELSKGTVYYNKFVNALNECNGCRMILLCQGGSDSAYQTPKETYRTRLNQLYKDLINDVTGTPAFALKVHSRKDDQGDVPLDNIRSTHLEFIRDTFGVYNAGSAPDITLRDKVHFDSAGCILFAERMALAALKELGESTFDAAGPRITHITLSGTNVVINVQHDTGTSLSGTSLTSIEVFDGSTQVTVNSFTVGTNTITANTSHTFTGVPQVRNAYGQRTLAQSVVPFDNSTYASYNGLPLQPTSENISYSKKAKVILVKADGSVHQNLININCVWFDEALPKNLTAPKQIYRYGQTNSSGELVLDLGTKTGLDVGDTGFLVVTNTDGTTTQNPAPLAFSGPVKITE